MARFTRGNQIALPADVVEATKPTQPAKPARVLVNKYGAKCVDCGVYVPEGTGNLTKNDVTDKWEVRHNQPCPEGTPLGQDSMGDITGEATPAPSARNFPVPDGRYTVAWENHHKTLRVQTQDEFDDFMPGAVILKHLTGANNDSDYTSFGHVTERGDVRIWAKHQSNPTLREAVKVLLGDPKAASTAYAMETEQCSRCGRTLSVPASIHAGLGPECARKVAW